MATIISAGLNATWQKNVSPPSSNRSYGQLSISYQDIILDRRMKKSVCYLGKGEGKEGDRKSHSKLNLRFNRRDRIFGEEGSKSRNSKSKYPSKARCLSVKEGEGLEQFPAGPQVVEVGDMVDVHFCLKTETGAVLQSSEGQEPLTFEVGAGQVMGNPLFQGFDAAVRGLAVGETFVFQSVAGERREELVFDVPSDHEEMLRLESEAESQNEGPLEPGSIVVLANGNPAVIMSMDEKFVRIDANHPLAGTTLVFEVEVASINKT